MVFLAYESWIFYLRPFLYGILAHGLYVVYRGYATVFKVLSLFFLMCQNACGAYGEAFGLGIAEAVVVLHHGHTVFSKIVVHTLIAHEHQFYLTAVGLSE